eukprot:3933827-Rhodomonas_salina.4
MAAAEEELTDEDDALCLGVVEEEFDAVHVVGAVEGVASDAHHRRLSQTNLCHTHHTHTHTRRASAASLMAWVRACAIAGQRDMERSRRTRRKT